MNVQEFLTAGATPSEDALQAFAACIQDIATLAQQFATFADEHGGISPDDVTWGHVGNLNQVIAYLTEAARWIALKPAPAFAQPSMFPAGEDAPLFTLPEDAPEAEPEPQIEFTFRSMSPHNLDIAHACIDYAWPKNTVAGCWSHLDKMLARGEIYQAQYDEIKAGGDFIIAD